MLSKEDREIISEIGRYKYNKMKEAGFNNFEDYTRFRQEVKCQNKKKCIEKNKIRFRTIRYIQRYCNLEMKCQICEQKAEIHHPNYKDYLKINLLCKKHHTELHNFELIPPNIIDLEKIKIKEPPLKGHTEYIKSKIDEIKKSILFEGKTMKDVTNKFHTSPRVIGKFLTKEENEEIKRKSKENGDNRRKIKLKC